MAEIKFTPNKFSRRIPYLFAKQQRICVYGVGDNGDILLAYADELKANIVSEIKRKLKAGVLLAKVDTKTFDGLLSEAYSSSNAAAIVDDVQDDIDLSTLIHNLPHSQDLLESENDAPIIRIINAFLTQAVKEDASDIHLDAYERQSVVRFRRDGLLQEVVELNPGLHAALVSRIKIMAQLDIAEKRLPQDGRIGLRLAGREVDLRVSIIPTGHGERVVLRLLDKNKERLRLESLGMVEETLQAIDKSIHIPHGIFLVTGPTGAGKSTTLYAALSRLNHKTLNIMTVEDPIEYDIAGISQTQINARIDMSFARALRSILRQDPDVVMIGEIRDLETAEIAVQASLTGHLVLATLHTNNAASAITRLIDMGVKSFLLSSTLVGILAQRLIRMLCPQCKLANEHVSDAILQQFHIPANVIVYRAVGCELCNYTGYKGRAGIYELLLVDGHIQRMIHSNSSEHDIEVYATQHMAMKTLRMDALRYILTGMTSIEEVIAVTESEGGAI